MGLPCIAYHGAANLVYCSGCSSIDTLSWLVPLQKVHGFAMTHACTARTIYGSGTMQSICTSFSGC